MTALPPAGQLALAGMVFVCAFGLWKAQLQPRLRRARGPAPNV